MGGRRWTAEEGLGGTRRQETGREITQGHEECRGTARFRVSTNSKGTSEKFRERHRQPCGCPAKCKDHGMDVIAPSAYSLGRPCARHSVSQQSLHTTRGARVEWKGRSRIYHSVPGTALHLQNPGLSWGLGWTRMGSFAYLTGLHGTWDAYPPTLRQKTPARSSIKRLGSHHLEARGSPSHS